MRQLGYLVTVLAVMGLAFWAYSENYRTQDQMSEMSKVQTEIASLRQQLGLLRAEWAYLNRPSRLRELVDLNFERLQLIPLTPDHLIGLPQIGYPDPSRASTQAGEAPDGDAMTDDDLADGDAIGLTPADGEYVWPGDAAGIPRPLPRPKGQ